MAERERERERERAGYRKNMGSIVVTCLCRNGHYIVVGPTKKANLFNVFKPTLQNYPVPVAD